MKISQMAECVTPSLTRKLFNMAREIGDGVIDLTLGDPDLLPPEEVRIAGANAIMQGKTRYSSNAGLIELRQSYASFFERTYGVKISPTENVIATVGGMEALFLSLASMADRGDEVIVIGPYYVNYMQMLNMLGATAVVVDREGKSDSCFIAQLQNAVTDKTVGLVVNSPCNPTGDILSGDELNAIASIAVKNDLFVVSDEVYNSLVYDEAKAESVFTRPGMRERTVVIDSCSKRFAMTGWRIGFAVGAKDVIANMTKLQENVAACAPLPSQYAAVRAYREDFDYSYIKNTYRHRRDLLVERIEEIPLLSCNKPKGTFYCFVNVEKTGLNSEQFAYALLESKHVAVVPGLAYGENYGNYIRIAFTLNDEALIEAMRRIKEFCSEIEKKNRG